MEPKIPESPKREYASPHTEQKENERGEMDIFGHLRELRYRIVVCIAGIAIASSITFLFSSMIFSFLSYPYHASFHGQTLIGTGPAEAFILKIKVSIFSGVILSSPLIFYEIWKFTEPGLLEHEKRYAIPFVFISTFLFLLGVGFCYFVVLPFAYSFFAAQYQSVGVTPTIKIQEHISFMLKTLMAFGIVFEMPIFAFVLGKVGIVTADTLIKGTRYAIVLIFLMAAMLTPPDVVSQILMAAPLLVLYGLSIMIVKMASRE